MFSKYDKSNQFKVICFKYLLLKAYKRLMYYYPFATYCLQLMHLLSFMADEGNGNSVSGSC